MTRRDILYWNIIPECISIIILLIIWSYSRKGSNLPTLTNQLFQACFLVTFLAISTNILSTCMLTYTQIFPIWMIELVTTIYFIFTPLMGMIYFLYSSTLIYNHTKLSKIMWLGTLPGLIYILIVLSNPFSHILFSLSSEGVYNQGSFIFITYLLFYLYCLFCLIIVIINKKKINYHIYKILSVFPLIAVAVIVIQQIYPNIILSGTAATMALLIIYLHLQNKQLTLDSLTNLPNRSELFQMMEILIEKYGHDPFVLLVISLRDFKKINESYGHAMGNELLVKFSEFLSSIAPLNSVYRFNGDEFAILIQHEQRHLVKQIIDLLDKKTISPWIIQDYSFYVSTVAGVATYPQSATTAEKILNAVEYAVIQAKRDSSKQVHYCDENIMNSINRRERIIEILKDKIAKQSFELYYQPIIDLKTGKYDFAESLVRIPNSSLGPLYPNEFIPIAEETCLIIEITYQILEKACEFINHLSKENIHIKSVHVNFSAYQFNESNLSNKVIEIIESHHIPLSKIKIEFTESTIAKNVEVVTHFANYVAQKGIRMGLDDFGTGYSNIATVIGIPFGTIKLDRSLILAAMDNEKSAGLVKNITRSFQDLGCSVVAEGVETKEQNQFVKDCQIDFVQGFYYAKPMPEKDVIEFLKHNT